MYLSSELLPLSSNSHYSSTVVPTEPDFRRQSFVAAVNICSLAFKEPNLIRKCLRCIRKLRSSLWIHLQMNNLFVLASNATWPLVPTQNHFVCVQRVRQQPTARKAVKRKIGKPTSTSSFWLIFYTTQDGTNSSSYLFHCFSSMKVTNYVDRSLNTL